MEYIILFLSMSMVFGVALYSIYGMDNNEHDKNTKAHH